jgi:hypothetical protein
MGMQTDVSAVSLTATGDVVAAPCRVKGIYFISAASAGSIILKDGGAAGTTRISLVTPAGIAGTYMELPGEGVLFRTTCHATITTATNLTVFYA